MIKRRFSCIFFVMILLSACNPQSEVEETQTLKQTVPTAQLVVRADELSRRHDDLAKMREAVGLLAQARNPEERIYEVEWKFARYNYFLGRLADTEKESDKAFADGAEAGKIAQRIEPQKADGYFWYGANLGEQARRAPLTKGLASIDDLRSAMNKVIEIEPLYEGASAYDVLAQIELNTRLTGGSTEKAVEYLEKAVVLDKDNTNVRLHLAQAYLAIDRDAEAKKQLDYLLKIKPDPDYMPEYEESVKETKKLLETRF